MKKIDISIIYINYKTCQLILDSIETVKKITTEVSYEIIIVDNNSEDNSYAKINILHPEITYIQSSENIGFGRANNLGIQKANGNYIFFLNPDTLLYNNAIKILFNHLKNNPNVAACGAGLLNESLRPTFSCANSFPSLFREILTVFGIYINDKIKIGLSIGTNVSFVIGAAMMIRKEILNKIGVFDPIFFMNYEETELCYRIKKANYKIHFVPTARVIHLEGKSDYTNRSRFQLIYDGKYLFFKKVYGKTAPYWLFHIQKIKCYLRIKQFLFLKEEKKREFWEMFLKTNEIAYLNSLTK